MTTQTASNVGRAAELAQFSNSGFGRRTLFETERLRAVVVGLEDGQEIPVHAPPLDVVITIVEGVGQVLAGDQTRWVRAGDVAVVAAGERRGLRAIGGRLVAVNVVSPPPADSDHVHTPASWPADEEAPDVSAVILKEHGELFPHLEDLGDLAARSSTLSELDLRNRVTQVVQFLRDGLLPHAREEELSVYPAAEKLLRAVGGATRTMSIDHRFVGALVDRVEGIAKSPLSDADREQLRRLLYGLQTLLDVHFTKENEAYVPLLNRLSPPERRQLYERLTGGIHTNATATYPRRSEPWPT